MERFSIENRNHLRSKLTDNVRHLGVWVRQLDRLQERHCIQVVDVPTAVVLGTWPPARLSICCTNLPLSLQQVLQ